MKKSILVKSILIAASLPLLAGCVERQVVYRDRPVYVQQPPGGDVVVAEPAAPPPPQVEVIPVAPDPTFVWVGGCWEWRGRWVWAGGHWGPRPHPGAVWVHSGWGWHGHHRVWVSGYWR
jgi:hypothetical protein